MSHVPGLYVDPSGNYPRHQGDIQQLVPSFVNGDSLPEGWLPVVETEQPETVMTDTEIHGYVTSVSIVDGIATHVYTAKSWPKPEPEPEPEGFRERVE
jgi:hypothetical protein